MAATMTTGKSPSRTRSKNIAVSSIVSDPDVTTIPSTEPDAIHSRIVRRRDINHFEVTYSLPMFEKVIAVTFATLSTFGTDLSKASASSLASWYVEVIKGVSPMPATVPPVASKRTRLGRFASSLVEMSSVVAIAEGAEYSD